MKNTAAILGFLLMSSTVFAGELVFSPVVKVDELNQADQNSYCAMGSGRSPCFMWYSDAQRYCESVGKRLPTAREWVGRVAI